MRTHEFITPPRQRIQNEAPSALSYWGTGIACLGFLVFVFWLAGMKF